MTKEELIDFLKSNLKIEIWCNYDGCDSPHPTKKVKKQQYEYTDKDGWSTYDINQKKWIKAEQPF